MVYQIPPFLMGQAANVDFSPVQNALAQWRQGQQQNIQNALARENLNWHRENALSQRQMDQKKLDWEMSKFDQTQEGIGELRKAQAAQALAHAGLFKAQSQFRYADPPAAVRQPILGRREDGSLYEMDAGDGTVDTGEPRVENRVLGGSNALGPETRREHADYGGYGITTTQVPGLVVRENPSRTSDKFGTQTYQGQRAIDKVESSADRQRFLDWKQTQDLWTAARGKPAEAGYSYNPDGTLRDLKDESKKALGREKISELIHDVRVASSVFKDSNLVGRGASGISGGWINPQYEQAARSVEHAVQFLTAEIEGKRHANAQDVRMLRFFAPIISPTKEQKIPDSEEMIQFKLDQLNRIMTNYFGARTPSGSLFKSELSKAAKAYDEAVKTGRVTPPSYSVKSPPAAGPDAGYGEPMPDFTKPAWGNLGRNPSNDRLKSKYGLE